MIVTLDTAGKRFSRDWIFRNFNYQFLAGTHYAITGPNGSGKSTLLQVIGGSMAPTEGTLGYDSNGASMPPEEVYRKIAIVAPYLELVEEMTASEFLSFHAVFKPLVLPVDDILRAVGLEGSAGKQIRNFSSGMKQRVKLAQAVFAAVPVLLLDEPCTNLDTAGYDLYHALISQYCADKLVIVSSNDVNEYSFCSATIDILDYKK